MINESLLSLLAVFGATGSETPVADALEKMLKKHVDEISRDGMGNLIAVKKGKEKGKRILISAHMDHIGFVVTDADEHGFVRVHNVGGIHTEASLGLHVVFQNGVQGVLYMQGDVQGSPKMQELFIDIGASSREEALSRVTIGDAAVYAPCVSKLGEYRVASPAMDDRAGCALLAELLMQEKKGANELVGVFSVQEEVGLRGAQVAGYAQRPDLCVALDVTATGDIPEATPKMAVEIGKGPAVKIMDRSLISAPLVRDALIAAAEKAGVPYQREVLTFGGTDAGAISLTRGGVPSGALSIPTRYVHSAIETIDLRDMENGVKLLKAFVEMKF